jgi:hypothetical protein
VLLLGCLIFLLWLPGMCLKQSQGWLDEIVAEAARADFLHDSVSTPIATTLHDPGGEPLPSTADNTTASLYFPDGRFSMTVVDGSRVELVFPAGWSASDLIKVVASGRTGQRNGDTWTITPLDPSTTNSTTNLAGTGSRDIVGPSPIGKPRVDTAPFKFTVTRHQ